jgi:beta-glucosidase
MPVAYKFPDGFLWGAATSSHQVEGNNRWNDWWEYEESGRLPHRSGEACRHYELYEQDFDLARSMGHNAHRFSIEWSRIEPAEGQWNHEALGHYRAVIAALRRRNIEPIVTLHHFTNPAWFSHGGGWLRRDSPTLFARYSAYIAEHLGQEVKYWLTVNEPTVYVLQGYTSGEWPPCLKKAWRKAILAFRNLAKAHRYAYRALHDYLPDVMVGFAHSAPLVVPCDSGRIHDRLAAAARDFFLNRAFFCFIGATQSGHNAERCLDFIGINYYTRTVISGHHTGLGALFGRVCRVPHHKNSGPISDIGWEVYPSGLGATLKRFSRFGLPLFVTENGIATTDEELRRDFLVQHLKSLYEALKDGGVTVLGYLYWSLIDNYEWALGMTPHFGLTAVNPNTQERLPRPCANLLEKICRENSIAIDS